jgi:opacity protein-like surface antigen
MRAVSAFLVGAALLSAVPASAQDEDRRVNFNVGGGYTITTGEARNHLGDGYNVNVGLIINATKVFGIGVDYTYNGLGEKQVSIPVSPTPGGSATNQNFFANMNMQVIGFNAVIKPKMEGNVKPYVVAGGGAYYRRVQVTTPGAGYVPGYCDPWWGFCYPGGWVPVDKIVGERSEWSPGIDFGGGVNFKVGDSASVFVEVKYHYIFGTDYSSGTTTQKSSSSYIPITFGIRF